MQFGYPIIGDMRHIPLFLSKRPEQRPSLRLSSPHCWCRCAEALFASVFGKFQIVGYFIAVRMGARRDAIRWVLKLIEFHEPVL
jgi:hypothetical protein